MALKNVGVRGGAPFDGEALGLLADTITRHIDATEALPDDQTITIERRSEALVINICQGTLINETIGHLLLAMASTKTGRWGSLMVEPTRIHLSGADLEPHDVVDWLNELPSDGIEGLLAVTLPNSRQVRWRFAQVAKTFGILRHGVDKLIAHQEQPVDTSFFIGVEHGLHTAD